jgi:hypothetical protein
LDGFPYPNSSKQRQFVLFRQIHPLARFKEHANKITLADNFAERAKRKEGNKNQKHDDTGRDQLIEGPAADLGDGVSDGPAVNYTDDDLLKEVEDE